MPSAAKPIIVIIGCGNVAWHIAKQLQKSKKFRIFIYNHRANPSLIDFKLKLKCEVFDNLGNIYTNASAYFICVSDKNITKVSSLINIENEEAVIFHTSGSAGLSDIRNRFKRKAVFYPVQSFSKNVDLNWANIPIAIECDDVSSQKKVRSFANLFSRKIFEANQHQRQHIHLSAVLVNNFVNALYVEASSFLKNSQIDFSILLPLIQQTTDKLNTLSPKESQTGPAKRNDLVTIKRHLSLLSKDKQLQKIYKLMSDKIFQQQNNI
jgi:predicted short-subunit dehydrogenase-like oxidoreductase (DUF2520 family)